MDEQRPPAIVTVNSAACVKFIVREAVPRRDPAMAFHRSVEADGALAPVVHNHPELEAVIQSSMPMAATSGLNQG